MLQLSRRYQIPFALVLVLLMLVTRGHHDFTLAHLPDASWAVFLLAGFYLRPRWFFVAFLLLAACLDYIAITWGGVSSFCVTGAYFLLIPAYGALWFAGRSYIGKGNPVWRDLIPIALHALAGTLVCELISSGGFYFFSGRFLEPTLGEFGVRLTAYLPGNLRAVGFYLGLAAVVHGLYSLLRDR